MTDRMKLLEAVAEAARALVDRDGITTMALRWAFDALDALPAQPQGETVTLAVWEDTKEGDVRHLRPGGVAEIWVKAHNWTRLGTVTLPLNTEGGA